MNASKPEQILQALQQFLSTVTKTVRNEALPETLPQSGLIIIRDGNPGVADKPLGGVGGCYYSHEIELEVYLQRADDVARDKDFDQLLQKIDETLNKKSTLGGLIAGMDYNRPSSDIEAIEGATAIKNASITLTVDYTTTTFIG